MNGRFFNNPSGRKAWCQLTKDPPRCGNCVEFRRPGEFLRDSLPVRSPPMCKLGKFITKETWLCDNWQRKKQ